MSALVVESTKFAHMALLPGRSVWVTVCHARPGACPVCLQAIAHLLAGEMDYVLMTAVNRTAESYQAELGREHCTAAQAEELRRLTCALCYGSARPAADVWLADMSSAPKRPMRGFFSALEDDGERQRRHAAVPDGEKQLRGPLVSVQVKVGLWWLVGLILATMAVL